MQPGAKPDVVGTAALVAKERLPCGDLVAICAKAHKTFHRRGTFCSPTGRFQMGAKRPFRLISSRVANQKIFSVCRAAVLRRIFRRRSEDTATSTRKRLCLKSVWNSPLAASWRYKEIFLDHTLRVSVPRSTSQNRQYMPDVLLSSKYPSGISGVPLES